MKERVLKYQVREIPDPFYLQYQMISGGDFLTAASRDFEHLLQAVSNFPPDSASVTIRFVFSPNPKNGDRQSRLGIYIIARAYEEVSENLRLLIERGPLGRFYNLHFKTQMEFPWEKLGVICEIVRREDLVTPLHSHEFNSRIPSHYYKINPFESNTRNDYQDLDRVLDANNETILIDICIQPTDIENELTEHTRYLSRLQSINRLWGADEDYDPNIYNFLDDETKWRSTKSRVIKPLRYKDPLADDILRSQQRFHDNLFNPHFLFHIKVLAETMEAAHLFASVVAGSAFESGVYRIQAQSNKHVFHSSIDSMKTCKIMTLPAQKFLFEKNKTREYDEFSRLSHLATVEEFSGIFRLPIASAKSPACIRKNTDPPISDNRGTIVIGVDQEVSNLHRGLHVKQLNKHVFVSGGSGFGKTTGIINLLFQLYRQGIPFLVLEPAKTDYRIIKTFKGETDKATKKLAEALQVYTPGNELVSPLRFNPLWIRPGISVDEHIDNILSCLLAAIPVSGPLPALLGEALERVYENHPDENYPPLFSDLVASASQVLSEKGYSPDINSDLRAALEVRIGTLTRRSIGKVFRCRQNLPGIDELMMVPSIVELDRLPTEQAALLILFLLMSVREYLKTVPKSDCDPRFVIIIEEAHNIVGNVGQALPSPDIPNPKAFAAEYICRMLAEMRSLGVGIVIVDQLPSAVSPEVIKNTASKIAYRQVAKDDREELGATMLLGESGTEEIARLNLGEAFFFTEGYHGPRRVQTENLHERLNFNTLTINEYIIPYVRNDLWFKSVTYKRIEIELNQLVEEMNRFDEKRLNLIKDFVRLIGLQPHILAIEVSEQKRKELMRLENKANRIKKHLKVAYQSFYRDFYQIFINFNFPTHLKETNLIEVRNNIISRFDSIIEPDVKKAFLKIDLYINRLQENYHGKEERYTNQT